jgi:hypothetical protein
MKTFAELKKINVNEHTEKKGSLTYLSWAWAVDQLLTNDPSATWIFLPPIDYNDTMMVRCEVTAFGKTLEMQLPVMDNRNNAIKQPDARKISDAQMRCLAKCIACFGIGLYIYAGEDVPQEDAPDLAETANEWVGSLRMCNTLEELHAEYKTAYKALEKDPRALQTLVIAKDEQKALLEKK